MKYIIHRISKDNTYSMQWEMTENMTAVSNVKHIPVSHYIEIASVYKCSLQIPITCSRKRTSSVKKKSLK